MWRGRRSSVTPDCPSAVRAFLACPVSRFVKPFASVTREVRKSLSGSILWDVSGQNVSSLSGRSCGRSADAPSLRGDCSAIVANGKELSHRLKNANETESKVWRYHHYNSRLDYTTKRAILFSTLRKVHKMAINSKQLHISAIAKCKEYIKLHYPVGILKYMCAIMARETANYIWLQVRREL